MNGIGGRTVEEAQRTMLMSEFFLWQKFRNKRGSLHTGMRVEESVAKFLAHWFNTKTKPDAPRLYTEDFAPHMDERVISLEEIAKQMGAI